MTQPVGLAEEEGVPLWIGNEYAEHTAAKHRMLNYHAVQGREGIARPTDCKITPLDTAGAGVYMMPGQVSAISREYANSREMYFGGRTQRVQVPVPETTSAGGRVDMMAYVFKDPSMTKRSWGNPPSLRWGPYDGPHRIENIGQFLADPAQAINVRKIDELNQGYTGYGLALLNLPASNLAVVQDHIIDIRGLAGGRTDDFADTKTPLTDDLVSTDTAWHDWPAGLTWSIKVPEFATTGSLTFGASGTIAFDGPFEARVRVQIRDGGTVLWTSAESPADMPANVTWQLPFKIPTVATPVTPVPLSWRGKTYTVAVQGIWISGPATSYLRVTANSRFTLRASWKESVE